MCIQESCERKKASTQLWTQLNYKLQFNDSSLLSMLKSNQVVLVHPTFNYAAEGCVKTNDLIDWLHYTERI